MPCDHASWVVAGWLMVSGAGACCVVGEVGGWRRRKRSW